MRQGYVPHDSFAVNEVRLLMSLISVSLTMPGAELLGRASREKLSRERFRTLLLKAAARVLLGRDGEFSRVIEATRARLWSSFWQRMERIYPARGSPQAQALPI